MVQVKISAKFLPFMTEILYHTVVGEKRFIYKCCKMKLIIQIPCYNEERSLGITLAQLPKKIEGVATIEWLVIDDGSSDETVQVAKRNNVHHIVKLPCHQGLSRAYISGLEGSLNAGADIIVNLDADNQYRSSDIEALIKPILNSQAELVVGVRPISKIEGFSRIKKIFHQLGSGCIRWITGLPVSDAPSGFRAMTASVALRFQSYNQYTYTIETLIQAASQKFAVASVPIGTNKSLRKSRLVKNIPTYIFRQIFATVLGLLIYRPFRFFMSIAIMSLVIGVIAGAKSWAMSSYSQIASIPTWSYVSLIGVTVFILSFLLALLGQMLQVNHQLLEKILLHLRKSKLLEEQEKNE